MKTQTIFGFFAALLACAGVARATDFYASSSGSAAGDGSIGNPWDLATALHHPVAVQPGDTIWVRGGTYSGAHTSRLAGTAGNPITVRAYHRERVVLDYAGNSNCNPSETDECSPNNKRCNALTVPACSHDVVFRDLEITNSTAGGRVSLPSGGCADAPECCYVNGTSPPLKPECSSAPASVARAQWVPLHIAGDRVKIVNCTVHDGGTGVTTDQQALDTEIYGALVFNNGWVDPASGQGHGLSLENTTPSWRESRKQVRNSVLWNNFGDGARSATTWGHLSSNLFFEDMISFNNGAPTAAYYASDPLLYATAQDTRYANLFLQADEKMRFIELRRCRLYQPASSAVQRQYLGGVKDADYEFHKDLIVEDSYIATSGVPLSLIRWDRVRTSGTTLIGGASPQVGDTEALVEFEKTECVNSLNPTFEWSGLDWEDNDYFFTGAGTQPFGLKTSSTWSYKTFANWRAAIYNRDATSTYNAGLPTTNAVFVQPNAYEPGRAHVAIYNWQGLNSVGVDLSTVGLASGQGFRVYNLQAFDNAAAADYFGTVVASGYYNPAQPVVNVPMTDTTVTSPIGLGATPASTLPLFGAFLIRATPCGDSVLDAGEACDDGNPVNGDGCDNNCTVSACGNGIQGGAEACDDGNAIDTDACKSDCTANVCGDASVHSGVEACDDGNATNGDGCDNNCTVSACGNGIAAGSEACDDGNAVNGDGCDTNCTVSACGNGIAAGSEACDDGNAVNGDGCDSNCTVSACGNGIAAGTEACDDGNAVNGDGCDSNCTVSACGNGIAAASEACDDGNGANGDGCDNNCTVTACGNAIVTATEACDDGNASNGDGCDTNCTVSACGNGIAAGSEACDDGNAVNGDGCDSNCTTTGCGNDIRTHGEMCDDGNASNGDGCETNCRYSTRTENLGGGGTLHLDPDNDGVDANEPMDLALQSPSGGSVSISTQEPSTEGDGFQILGVEFVIEAPVASTAAPLVLTFTVDASLIPDGVTVARLTAARDGEPVPDCDGPAGTASPDPCVSARTTLAGGDVELTVLTSHASTWSVGVRGLTDAEQACVNGMNTAAFKLAKAQASAAGTCLKNAIKGTEADPQACLTADASGKIADGQLAVTAMASERCGTTPPFGFAGAGTINTSVVTQQLGLVTSVFGGNLTAAVANMAASTSGKACQEGVFKGVRKLFETHAKGFLKCKKNGLSGKTSLMVASPDLEGCFDMLAADADGKLGKAVAKLADAISKKCTVNSVDLTLALPGACASAANPAECLNRQVACRLCQTFNAADGLNESCDLYDDGTANSSCN